MSGHKSAAQQILDKLAELSRQRYVAPVDIEVIYAGLEERDRAFEWLEKAYEGYDPALMWYKTEPTIQNLRSDPRFADLVRRVERPR